LLGNATEKTEARFWDLEGRETRDPLPHNCMALAVAFSPDGRMLLTGHWDFKARLWDLKGPKDPVGLEHDAPVRWVASPDGKPRPPGSLDGPVRFGDLTGRLPSPPLRHGGLVSAVAFDANTKAALVGVSAENASRLWDLAPESRNGMANPKD